MIIAVWDGQVGQGEGGTATVTAKARELGLPIAWVYAGNGEPGTREAISLGGKRFGVACGGFV